MIYTKKEQLTLLELKNNEKSVSIKDMKTVLEKNPTNIIYCETKGKLVGIISTGDILRAYEKGKNDVEINTKFIYLNYGEYSKAKKMFNEKKNINAIPVVDKSYTLLGDYTRWDDLSALEYVIDAAITDIAQNWKDEKQIALVRPNHVFKNREKAFQKVRKYLMSWEIMFTCIEFTEVADYLNIVDMVLFVDENEIRACHTVLKMTIPDYYKKRDKLKTYKSFFLKEINFSDKQCEVYLKRLLEKGVKIVGLVFRESTYYKQLSKRIEEKFVQIGKKPCNKLPEIMYQDFFVNYILVTMLIVLCLCLSNIKIVEVF